MKIPSKRELQQIALNHSSEIRFKDFMKVYKDFTQEPYLPLLSDTTLSSNQPKLFVLILIGQSMMMRKE